MAAAVLGGAEFGDFDRWSAEMDMFGVGGLALRGEAMLDTGSVDRVPRELTADWIGGLAAYEIDPDGLF